MGLKAKRSACLALYGCESTLVPAVWIDHAERYFAFIGISPSVCIVSSSDGRSRRLRWKSVHSKVSALKNICSVSCYAEPNESTSLFSWEAAAVWSLPLTNERPSVFFGYGESAGVFSADTCELIGRNIVKDHHVAYGIGYERENAKGPEAYAIGMPMGLSHSQQDNVERKQIGQWAREFAAPYPGDPERFRYLRGMLRDIYPVSILSNAHLCRQISGITLREWIAQTSSRGVLKKLSSSNWLWAIEPENIQSTRKSIVVAELLIVDVQPSVASA